MWTQEKILKKVEKQIAKWIPEKYGWTRNPHRTYMRFYKILGHMLIGRKKWDSRNNNLALGTDEFGRDVSEGMQRYVDLLRSRGLKLNTVLVLGSRAKGRSKPSSDIDVTVIAENIPVVKKYPIPLNRIVGLKRWFLLSDIPLFMDLEVSQCYTKEEFMKTLKAFDMKALDAVYYGSVQYDDGSWEEVKAVFAELERKYKLDETDLKRNLSVL